MRYEKINDFFDDEVQRALQCESLLLKNIELLTL